jgi:glycosyltransferase domain-containing protein
MGMDSSPDALTLLLPLKGRHLHTLRFLWHADRIRLPWPIMIADGQVHPTIARLLEDPTTFPNLRLHYIRYPDDRSFSIFYRKMADATSRVATPYVLLVDNDDFVVRSGIDPSIEFLQSHPDYACSGAGISGFELFAPAGAAFPHVVGPINRLSYRYSPDDRSDIVSDDSAAERVYRGCMYTWSCYSVTRTPVFATVMREISEFDPGDLLIQERFWLMRLMTLGKARSDASRISYLRQYKTSLLSVHRFDWVYDLLRGRFTAEFAEMIERISRQIAASDGIDVGPVAERLREICDRWLRTYLRHQYGTPPLMIRLKQFVRDHTADWLMRIRERRLVRAARQRRNFIADLRRDGASEDYLRTFRSELADIESTLSGAAFLEFARRVAPDLVAGPAPSRSK